MITSILEKLKHPKVVEDSTLHCLIIQVKKGDLIGLFLILDLTRTFNLIGHTTLTPF